MSKNQNYNSKFAGALKKLMKQDEDLGVKGRNENAFNSNLYRRVTTNKLHKIDMEYDDYKFEASVAILASPTLREYILDVTSKGDYRPKPDVIVHNDSHKVGAVISRHQDSLFAVAECKFNDHKAGIGIDYLKLCAYQLRYPNIQYLNLVVYPKKHATNLQYKILGRKSKIGNKTRLDDALNLLAPNEGTVLQATPYPSTIQMLFGDVDLEAKFVVNREEGKIYISGTDEVISVDIDTSTGELSNLATIDNIPAGNNPPRDILTNRPTKPEYDRLIAYDPIKNLLAKFGIVKQVPFGDYKYLRSGVNVKDESAVSPHDENYEVGRNTVILTFEDDEFKLIVRGKLPENIVGFEETTTSYSDNPQTKGRAYRLRTNRRDLESFATHLRENEKHIGRAVINTIRHALNMRDLMGHWTQAKRELALQRIQELKTTLLI